MLLPIATIALPLLTVLYRWQDRLLHFPDRAPGEKGEDADIGP